MADDQTKFDLVPIALKAMGHKADLLRAWQLIKYVLDAFRRVSPELVPLIKNLAAVFLPKAARSLASEYGTITITVQVIEVQHALGVEVDGVIGDVTEEAIRQYQIKNGLLPDGWFGRATFISMGKQGLIK